MNKLTVQQMLEEVNDEYRYALFETVQHAISAGKMLLILKSNLSGHEFAAALDMLGLGVGQGSFYLWAAANAKRITAVASQEELLSFLKDGAASWRNTP